MPLNLGHGIATGLQLYEWHAQRFVDRTCLGCFSVFQLDDQPVRFPVKPTFFMQGRVADGYPRLNLRAAVWRRGLEARGHLIKPPRELTKLMVHRILDCVSKSPTKELFVDGTASSHAISFAVDGTHHSGGP